MTSKLQELLEVYNHAKERFGIESVEYEAAIENIEQSINNDQDKAIIADAITDGKLIAGYGDDYLHLWHLRKLDMNGDPEVLTALDYFINSDKPRPAYYAEVMFIAMYHNIDITNFLENLCIVSTSEFIKSIQLANENASGSLAGNLLNYLKGNPLIQESESIKCLRILSTITSAFASNSLDLFEAAARIQHRKYGNGSPDTSKLCRSKPLRPGD